MKLTTALLILPPYEVQAFAAPLREVYAPESFARVPAHITLLYPFVPLEEIDNAASRLRSMLAEVKPFEINLGRYSRFEKTVFLEPVDPKPVIELHRRLAAAFPEYPIYGGEHGPDLHPHLTLASRDDLAEGEVIELPPAPSFTFEVDRLYMYSGPEEGKVPFIPVAIIPIGGSS